METTDVEKDWEDDGCVEWVSISCGRGTWERMKVKQTHGNHSTTPGKRSSKKERNKNKRRAQEGKDVDISSIGEPDHCEKIGIIQELDSRFKALETKNICHTNKRAKITEESHEPPSGSNTIEYKGKQRHRHNKGPKQAWRDERRKERRTCTEPPVDNLYRRDASWNLRPRGVRGRRETYNCGDSEKHARTTHHSKGKARRRHETKQRKGHYCGFAAKEDRSKKNSEENRGNACDTISQYDGEVSVQTSCDKMKQMTEIQKTCLVDTDVCVKIDQTKCLRDFSVQVSPVVQSRETQTLVDELNCTASGNQMSTEQCAVVGAAKAFCDAGVQVKTEYWSNQQGTQTMPQTGHAVHCQTPVTVTGENDKTDGANGPRYATDGNVLPYSPTVTQPSETQMPPYAEDPTSVDKTVGVHPVYRWDAQDGHIRPQQYTPAKVEVPDCCIRLEKETSIFNLPLPFPPPPGRNVDGFDLHKLLEAYRILYNYHVLLPNTDNASGSTDLPEQHNAAISTYFMENRCSFKPSSVYRTGLSVLQGTGKPVDMSSSSGTDRCHRNGRCLVTPSGDGRDGGAVPMKDHLLQMGPGGAQVKKESDGSADCLDPFGVNDILSAQNCTAGVPEMEKSQLTCNKAGNQLLQDGNNSPGISPLAAAEVLYAMSKNIKQGNNADLYRQLIEEDDGQDMMKTSPVKAELCGSGSVETNKPADDFVSMAVKPSRKTEFRLEEKALFPYPCAGDEGMVLRGSSNIGCDIAVASESRLDISIERETGQCLENGHVLNVGHNPISANADDFRLNGTLNDRYAPLIPHSDKSDGFSTPEITTCKAEETSGTVGSPKPSLASISSVKTENDETSKHLPVYKQNTLEVYPDAFVAMNLEKEYDESFTVTTRQQWKNFVSAMQLQTQKKKEPEELVDSIKSHVSPELKEKGEATGPSETKRKKDVKMVFNQPGRNIQPYHKKVRPLRGNKVHSTKGPSGVHPAYTCQICKKKFKSYARFFYHLRHSVKCAKAGKRRLGRTKYVCRICDRQYTTNRGYEKHSCFKQRMLRPKIRRVSYCEENCSESDVNTSLSQDNPCAGTEDGNPETQQEIPFSETAVAPAALQPQDDLSSGNNVQGTDCSDFIVLHYGTHSNCPADASIHSCTRPSTHLCLQDERSLKRDVNTFNGTKEQVGSTLGEESLEKTFSATDIFGRPTALPLGDTNHICDVEPTHERVCDSVHGTEKGQLSGCHLKAEMVDSVVKMFVDDPQPQFHGLIENEGKAGLSGAVKGADDSMENRGSSSETYCASHAVREYSDEVFRRELHVLADGLLDSWLEEDCDGDSHHYSVGVDHNYATQVTAVMPTQVLPPAVAMHVLTAAIPIHKE